MTIVLKFIFQVLIWFVASSIAVRLFEKVWKTIKNTKIILKLKTA
jgi:hypothetical protein